MTDLSESTVHRLYWDDGLSLREIADELDVSLWTVRKAMDEHEIPRRGSGEAIQHDAPYKDEEWMRRLYVEEGYSQLELAEKFECASSTINRWLNKLDIETRPSCREQFHSLTTDDRGYEVFTVGDTKVQHHRLLALVDYELDDIRGKHIHHKNNIPWDNRRENVEPLSLEEHGVVTREMETSN